VRYLRRTTRTRVRYLRRTCCVQVGKQWYQCRGAEDEVRVPDMRGALICPDPAVVCLDHEWVIAYDVVEASAATSMRLPLYFGWSSILLLQVASVGYDVADGATQMHVRRNRKPDTESD
jgi:hypothetical protein